MNWNIKNAQPATDVPFIFYTVDPSNYFQTKLAAIAENGTTYETGILFYTLIWNQILRSYSKGNSRVFYSSMDLNSILC